MIEVSACSSTGRDRENGVRGVGVGGMEVLRDERQGRRRGEGGGEMEGENRTSGRPEREGG